MLAGTIITQPAFAVDNGSANNQDPQENEQAQETLPNSQASQEKPLQELLISEIVPATDSFNTGHDVYEYIKLYNPTDRRIYLNDYVVRLRYVGGSNGPWNDKHWNFPDTELYIEPHDTFIVWIANPGNSGNNQKSVSDFNQYWGTDFEENKNIVKMGTGLSNSNRGIAIATKSGRAICEAFLTNSGKGIYKKGFTYSQTENHDLKLALNLEEGQTQPSSPASPASVPTNFEDVQINNDTNAPSIKHEQSSFEFRSGDTLTIDAEITDDTLVSYAKVFYKFDNETAFLSNLLVKNYEDTLSKYAIDLSDSDITGKESMEYYVETSDGKNVTKTETYKVQLHKEFPILTEVQELLVSEIVPDTNNFGSIHDVYEYVEIYNPTDRQILLDDYVIRYRYVSTGQGPWNDLYWHFPVDQLYIEPNQVLVAWINNPANTNKTVKDFNNYWHTNLVENKTIVRIGTGLANTNRGIAIATKSGRGIAEGFLTDNGANIYEKAFTYRQIPNNGLKLELILSGNNTQPTAKPTPGVAPTHFQRLYIADDETPPVILHEQPATTLLPGEDYKITADITDNNFVSSVAAYYRFDDEQEFKKLETSKLYESYTSIYPFHWYAPDLLGKKTLEYYLEASDGKNVQRTETYRVDIQSKKFEGLRSNLEESQVISGSYSIQATDDKEHYDSLTLAIDGNLIAESQLKKVLEMDPFFVANINQMNYNFKNAIIINDEVVHALDEDSSRHILTRPIKRNYIAPEGEQTLIRISSGTLSSFMDYDYPENRDDFDLKNVSLLFEDGTEYKPSAITPKDKEAKPYADETTYYIGDGSRGDMYADFVFDIPESQYNTKAYELDTKTLADGEHELTIYSDSGEKKLTFVVDNSAPKILSNLDDKIYKGTFEINPAVKDAYSEITSLQAWLDGKEIELPYSASSAELLPGKHELKVTATDSQNNTATKTFSFQTAVEHPVLKDFKETMKEKNGELSAELSLFAEDVTDDRMDVQFFEGYQYNANSENVTISENASETEPPNVFEHPEEKIVNADVVSLIAERDGKYAEVQSGDKFPYHRFDIKVADTVQPTDKIEIKWNGKSLPGRKVTMYAFNHQLEKWMSVVSEIYEESDLSLTGEVTAEAYVKDSAVNVIVQDEVASMQKKVEHPLFEGIDTIDYTFGVMPDTQFYSESYPDIYNLTSNWFVENRDALNLKYIFHLGDIVNSVDQPYQWENASAAMKILDDERVPYGLMTGNHDVGQNFDHSAFYQYFGESRYIRNPWYGGSYKNNRGHYDLIESNGNQYIMLAMGWGIGEEEVQWMNQVLQEYSNRTGILFFHDYLNEGATRTTQGQYLYDKVVLPNKNVKMVMNGHIHGAANRIDPIDDNHDGKTDREVVQILVDYQSFNGGQGYIRVMGFDMTNNKVYVRTYSPHTGGNYLFTPEQDNFEFSFDMTLQEKLIATDYFEANVYTNRSIDDKKTTASGKTVKTQWNGLAENASYGWYAVASDEYGGYTRSSMQTFIATKPADGTDPGDGSGPDNGTNPNDGPNSGNDTNPNDGTDVNDGKQPDNGANQNNGENPNDGKNPDKDHAMPDTATGVYTLTVIGLLTIFIGAAVYLYQRRRRHIYNKL
ncbi:metallophosphoesterase [Bacillaceae bacterium Marseille-Q3522]|nr:metallophosphoesterase [Bacillaceae bacterium Marseille-Q3522]